MSHNRNAFSLVITRVTEHTAYLVKANGIVKIGCLYHTGVHRLLALAVHAAGIIEVRDVRKACGVAAGALLGRGIGMSHRCQHAALLQESGKWELVPGGKYYMTRGGASIMAFRIPEGTPKGFLMSASHADRPTFKVKENGELVGKYTRLAVERYGGMLIAPWLDRPLSIAGRVLVETENGILDGSLKNRLQKVKDVMNS